MFRIIYVDDDPNLLELGKLFLETDGAFTVDTFLSADEVLGHLKSAEYDAIVSDYQMPVMDGITLLKTLRRRGNTTPFIIFTGKGREEVVIEALNNGADFYIQKGGEPVSQYTELAHKVRQAVQRRRAEKSIRDHERREADILNFLPDATFAIDTKGVVISWNHAMEMMTGVPASAILGKGDYEYAIPFYHERRPILIDLVFAPEDEIRAKYSFVKGDGNVLTTETVNASPRGKDAVLWGKAVPIHDTHGTVIGAIESIRDITDRRKVKDALAESERRYRNIVEDQTEFICRFLPDGTHVFVNDAYCRYFNKTREELVGTKYKPEMLKEDQALVSRQMASLTKEHPVDTNTQRIIAPDGTIRWQRWSTRAFFNPKGKIVEYQSVGRDITELKRSKDALYREKIFSDTVINSIPGVFCVVSREGKYIRCNRFLEEMLGLPAEQICGTSAFSSVLREERTPVERAMAEAFSKGYAEIRAKVCDKRKLVRDYFITYRRMNIGDEEYVIGTGIDMTEKFQSVRAMEESERKYRTLFDSTGTAMFILEEDTTISLANTEFEKMSGYTKEEVEGKISWTKLVVPEDTVWMMDYHIRRRQKDAKEVPQNYKFHFLTRDNSIRTMFLSITLIPDSKQTIVSLVDITEREQLEESFRQSNKKLVLLNKITRHDLLNKITVILGYIKIAENKCNDPALPNYTRKMRSVITEIKSQIEFTRIYQDLGTHVPQWQNLDTLMPRSQVPETMTLTTDIKGVEVFADPMLERVFFNLLDNSIRHGEHVTEIRVSASRTDNGLMVVWEDNGAGIPREEREKIFEQGFGKNSGLGLFLVREILSLTDITIKETGTFGNCARFEVVVPEGAYRETLSPR
jgi:PAS domain S-box-containing protein